MRKSFVRNNRKDEFSLDVVYIGSAVMIFSDCLWTVISSYCNPGNVIAYIINLLYFLGSSASAAYWYFFCRKQLQTIHFDGLFWKIIGYVPYDILTILYLLSPWYGFIFSIENGAYVRGSIFYIDPVIKMGYSVNSESLLYERNENLANENLRLEQVNASIIESVAKIVEARDSGSGDHIIRVKKLTEIIAREIMAECPEYNLDEKRVKLISSASVLHDVGKIVIPDAVLLKPGKLTDEEFEIMKTHTTRGCDILNLFPLGLDDAFLECALSICRWHHEKYDGKGYPDGLIGESIPIAAQIVAAADCYDALVSERPYKAAFSPEESFDMLMKGECGTFSPKILNALQNQKSKLTELTRLYR